MKRLGQILAGLVAVERIHSLVKQISPRYEAWQKHVIKTAQTRLGLTKSLRSTVARHLGLPYLSSKTYAVRDFRLGHFQINSIARELAKYINPNAVISQDGLTFPTDSKDIISFIPYGDSLDDVCEFNLLDKTHAIVDWPANGKEWLSGIGGNGERTWTGRGISIRVPVLAKYNNIPVVVYVSDTTCAIGYRISDRAGLTDFIDAITKFDRENTCDVAGLVLRSYLQRSIVLQSKNTQSANQNLADDFRMHFSATAIDNNHRSNPRTVDFSSYPEEVKSLIFRDMFGFIEQMDTAKSQHRNYLLTGPPGTGKTTLIRDIIASLPEKFTTLIINRRDVEHLRELRWWTHAPLFPALIVIEDIDLIADNNAARHELLSFLDGMDSPRSFITLMTTNHPEKIIEAIRDRPGRVDRIVEILPGNEKVREEQVRALLGEYTSDVSPSEIASQTGGFSVAKLKEVINRAKIYTKGFSGHIPEESMRTVLAELLKPCAVSSV